jgi:hypothetical protein
MVIDLPPPAADQVAECQETSVVRIFDGTGAILISIQHRAAQSPPRQRPRNQENGSDKPSMGTAEPMTVSNRRKSASSGSGCPVAIPK